MSENTALIERYPHQFDFEDFRPEMQKQAKTSLKHLCQDILGYQEWDICHDQMVEWDLGNQGRRFRLYLMPRGHLKTSVLTIGKTIQDVLKDPNTSILLASAVWDNARSFLDEIKDYLSGRSLLPQIFGRFESARWNRDEIIDRHRTKPNKTPTIDTAGVEKTLTSQHYKIIRADDLVTRENITTQEQMLKVIHYLNDLIKLLEPNGLIEVIGTRWHDSDLYGHIIDDLAKPDLGKDAFAIYKRSAVENGAAIFPKKFSLESLNTIKRQVGTYEYSCNYENEPISDETQHFKPPYRHWDELPRGGAYFITFDPATSEKKGACDAVVLVGCFTHDGQIFVVDYKAFERKDPDRMIDKIFEYAAKYFKKSYGRVGIEVNGGQEIYLKLIKDEMTKRNVQFEIEPIHQHMDKFSRIIALQPKHESGNLLLKAGMFELEEQMMRFPVAKKLDVIDALAMQLQIWKPEYSHQSKVYIPERFRAADNFGLRSYR